MRAHMRHVALLHNLAIANGYSNVPTNFSELQIGSKLNSKGLEGSNFSFYIL
jgi:hypothetical protein